jgi:hypothetical protein
VLTKITAHSQWANVDPLDFNVINRPDTDLFEVRNIDGLGPVKANVNTTPMGSVDGESFVGSSVGKRNIVLALGLTPDWDQWTVSRLRRLLDKYFMPKLETRLVFESMEFSPVEISGYVESNEPNMFSKDPEHQISIICPELYFKSVDPVTIATGQTDQVPWPIDYEGNVETGLIVRVSKMSGADPTYANVGVHDSDGTYIEVQDLASGHPVDSTKDLYVNTVPGDKYAKTITNAAGPVTVKNLLNYVTFQPTWPVIGPGTESFYVASDAGVQSWVMSYYNRFGSL